MQPASLPRQSPTTLEIAINIELDEVVAQDVSDAALELAASGGQGGMYTGVLFLYC